MWGYACCHSSIHLSYCAGDAGKNAILASSAQHLLSSSSPAVATERIPNSTEQSETVGQNYSKKRMGEGDVKFDQDRLQQAIQEEKKRRVKGQNEDERSTKKQKIGLQVGSHDVTEEELGVYNLDYSSLISLTRFLQRHTG